MVFEKELYPPLLDYLEKKGYSYYQEVKFFTRQIDLIAIKTKEIIAIEVKVENWQKALQQALTCKLCANKVYIAFWHEHIDRIPQKKLKKHGIGLLAVNGSVERVIKARKSQLFFKQNREEILREIMRKRNGRIKSQTFL